MTELETLERAKMYMEKLANGIDPISGMAVAEEDVINNVRLSRCFFYVADILEKVIENGGVFQQKKGGKVPFFLPIEKRNGFAFSAQPIPISEVAKRLNALVADENMVKLPYRAIRDWLTELGMLEETVDGDGKKAKRPTSRGENMGIRLESRMGQYGAYLVVEYDLEAQHFIVDNLDAILERERSKIENQGQPWLPEHDKCLRDLYAKGVPAKEIAITLKRNGGEVRARLKKLGLGK